MRARVANLSEFAPEMTVDLLREKLLEAFEEVYGGKADIIKVENLDAEDIAGRTQRFASLDWIFGKKLDFQYELSTRFPWGQVALQFKIKNGKIEDMNVFSDSMKPELMDQIRKYLQNIRYDKNAICAELGLFWSEDKEEEQMMKDVIAWIETADL